jgi:hypothetical protein
MSREKYGQPHQHCPTTLALQNNVDATLVTNLLCTNYCIGGAAAKKAQN